MLLDMIEMTNFLLIEIIKVLANYANNNNLIYYINI
jgi:hypothetical protein